MSPAHVQNAEKEQQKLAPGSYTLLIERTASHPTLKTGIRIGVGNSVERTVILKLATLTESIAAEGKGSAIEARANR